MGVEPQTNKAHRKEQFKRAEIWAEIRCMTTTALPNQARKSPLGCLPIIHATLETRCLLRHGPRGNSCFCASGSIPSCRSFYFPPEDVRGKHGPELPHGHSRLTILAMQEVYHVASHVWRRMLRKVHDRSATRGRLLRLRALFHQETQHPTFAQPSGEMNGIDLLFLDED